MAYTKQTWNTGDVITAEKLNHIEYGIDSSITDLFVLRFWITFDGGEPVFHCNKTYSEIDAEYQAHETMNMIALYCGGTSGYIYFNDYNSSYIFNFWTPTNSTAEFQRINFGVSPDGVTADLTEFNLIDQVVS